MAKKEIRMVVASGDAAGLVDHGFDVDVQLKNLGFEDKGIKVKLGEMAAAELAEAETSVRLRGERAMATVSATEKVELDVGSDAFQAVRKAIDAGLLEGFVERKLSLVVPPADVERAVLALGKAGIMATAAETLAVKAESLRTGETASVEQCVAVKALKACARSETTYRVKYEKA